MAIACVTHFVRAGQPMAVVVREWRFGLYSVLQNQHVRELRRFEASLQVAALEPEQVALRFIEFLRAQNQPNEEVLLYPTPWHPDLLGLQPHVVHLSDRSASSVRIEARV